MTARLSSATVLVALAFALFGFLAGAQFRGAGTAAQEGGDP